MSLRIICQHTLKNSISDVVVSFTTNLQSTLILSPTALALGLGKTVHGCLLKSNVAKDISLQTALLEMYAKNGELGSAQKIYNSLEKKDVVMQTSMINGLAIHGHGNEA